MNNQPKLYSFGAICKELAVSASKLNYILLHHHIEPTARPGKCRYFSEGKLNRIVEILREG